ncbi:hypothetical protein WA158_006755 [Blastocystis sp. Blastoise]
MIPFMENAKVLDILPLKDVVSIHSDIHYFFGDESYEDKMKIYTFLWDSLNNFIVNNKCELLLKPLIIYIVDFSEDIPYEYIYSSNLHEVFPKLETFLIEPSYYSQRKEICIPPSDPYYTFEKNNLLLYNNKYISYMKFIFIQDGERDIQHLIVELSFSSCSTILFYLLHLPIMKHTKQLVTLQNPRVKIQFDIPPLLITIRDGLVDTIIIFNIFNFIQPGSYPEYIQLFKDIITTHVFPNVTTLKITYYSYDLYIPLLQVILQLITRNHFPKLHIYDISDIIQNDTYIYKENYKFVLFSESIIQLMDTIIYDKDIFSDILENVVVYPEISEAILNTNNTNYFTIQVYEMKYTRFDISQINLKKLNPDEDEEYEYDSDYDYDEDDSHDENENINVNQYIYEYFSFLSVGNYKNVTTLSIDDITFYSIHGYIKNKIKVETIQMLYHFFSLFSNNLTRIELTFNKNEFNDLMTNIYSLFKNNKLKKLQTLEISYISKDNDSFDELFTYIMLFKEDYNKTPSCFKQIILNIQESQNEYTIQNILESFPSFSFSFHNSIQCISMNIIMKRYKDIYIIYCKYIYNQLEMEYTKFIVQLDLLYDV